MNDIILLVVKAIVEVGLGLACIPHRGLVVLAVSGFLW